VLARFHFGLKLTLYNLLTSVVVIYLFIYFATLGFGLLSALALGFTLAGSALL
jgi:hypothetical protein